MKRKQIVIAALLVLTVAWTAFIFSNSLDSGHESGEKSGTVHKILNEVAESLGAKEEIPESTVRTLAHFTEFAVLAFLLAADLVLLAPLTLSEPLSRRHALPLSALPVSFVTAVIDECIQHFSPGRAMQFLDVMIDTGGALCGLLGFFLLFFIVRALRQCATAKKGSPQ